MTTALVPSVNNNSGCKGLGFRATTWSYPTQVLLIMNPSFIWVAVKELKLSYHNGYI